MVLLAGADAVALLFGFAKNRRAPGKNRLTPRARSISLLADIGS
jgi:hypothetical protein